MKLFRKRYSHSPGWDNFLCIITVITMLVTDILYVIVDPRIKSCCLEITERRKKMNSMVNKRFELADPSKFDADEVVRPNISYWQDAWRRLKKNKLAMLSMGVLLILFVMSVIGLP